MNLNKHYFSRKCPDFLRFQDTQFIYHLKTIAPSIQIIYVCNKVEDDPVAMEMDRFSGSDDSSCSDCSGSDNDDGNSKRDRGKLAFIKLQTAGLLDNSLTYPVTLENYHAISCTEIRNSRLKKRNSPHMERFLVLKDVLIRHFSSCVNSHLSKAVSSLLNSLKRLFDFFISDKMIRFPKSELVQTVQDIKARENSIYRDMDVRIREQWYVMIEKMLFRRLEADSIGILEAVKDLEFQPIIINDQQPDNHVIKACRLQVRDFVLMMAVNGFEQELATIQYEFERVWQENSRAIARVVDSRAQTILQNHLTVFWQRDGINFNMAALKDTWVAGLSNSVKTNLNQLYENMKFAVSGIYLNAEWKEKTAASVIRSIDPHSLTRHIVGAIRDKLTTDHQVTSKAGVLHILECAVEWPL